MIKSLKSKAQSLKSIKNIGLLFVIVLFLAGCVTTQEYVYEDDVFRKKSETLDENQLKEKKKEWIGSYLKEDSLPKQCPACRRRYQISLEKCPYDGTELEEIAEDKL
jgi:hypothetical protein